jgi:uncharacterized protein
MTGMDNITLLIKPSSHRCNIECTYCFYRRVKALYPDGHSFMTIETAEMLIRKALRLGCRECQFCWQGGEPTLMGIDFFREIVRLQKKHGLSGQVIGNSIQTNGILIDDNWAQFLAENSFLVGLSLDGPEDVHDRYRRTPAGKGTFNKVMNAARTLRQHGAAFNILTLLTDRNVKQAERLYGFFRREGFSHLQFVPCMERNPATGEILPYSIMAEDLGRFHCSLFDLWMKDGFYDVSIRTFEDILIYYVDGVHTSCNWLRECASYVVVEHNGDVYPCDFFVYPEWKLGNIREDSYHQILENPLRRKFARMKSGLPGQCRSCRWLDFCHGDCSKFRVPAGDAPESVSALCEARKMLFEHMEPHLPLIREKALKVRAARQSDGRRAGTGRNERCPCGSGLKYKKCCGC